MSKFGHERRNRQEKTWKEPTGCADGKESPGLWSFIFTPDQGVLRVLNRKVASQISRADLVEGFRRDFRRCRFVVSGYRFKFSWGMGEFAKQNGLDLLKAKPLFDLVRNEAKAKFEIVMQRIIRHGIRMHEERDEAGRLVLVPKIHLSVLDDFLERDDGEST
jgi:hypothetical protein